MSTITVIVKDIQASLLHERKKLDDARNISTATADSPQPAQVGNLFKYPTPARFGDRVKKIWNEDIERSIRRIQNKDWERMGRTLEGHVKRARERMISSFERMGEDAKKNST